MEYVLMHHGVLGQKWGVRRYQNEDGTLTAAGKRRAFTYREKVRSMSDDELRKTTQRLNLENNYMNARQQNKSLSMSRAEKMAKEGEKWAGKILTGLGSVGVAAVVAYYKPDIVNTVTAALESLIKK